jgi:uncharacterized membrane protein YraQ (UPF0718 family)
MTKNDFANQMWFSYKARFNAHSRLLNQDMFYTVTTSLLSLFVISINILQLIPDLSTINQSATTFYTIVTSIFILIIGLIINLSNRKHNAEKFHSCALEIKRLYGLFYVQSETMKDNEFADFVKKYNAIEKKYDINHSFCDYKKVVIEKQEKNLIKKLGFIIKYYIVNYFFCSVLLILPVVLGICIIF